MAEDRKDDRKPLGDLKGPGEARTEHGRKDEQFLRENEEPGTKRWGTKAARGPDEAGPNRDKTGRA